ncbi:hypothetical protein K1719_047243, partial [Acacia pycnantha]
MAAGYLVASPTVRYVYDKFNDLLSAWDLDWFTSRVHPYLPSPFDYGIPPVTGRLGQTIEGGGKRKGEYSPLYALLGDDIFIADEEVAREYSAILKQLDVQISLPKSIVSRNGTMEFAKRYWTKDMQVPISLRALTACRSTVGLVQLASKYNITSVNVLQRLAGAGYRVRARLMSNQSKRWTRLKVAAGKPFRSGQLPLEFLIGRGSPLNPYLKGKMVAYLLREIRPKEIKLFPQELVFDGEREILERTVLHRWMKQWLKWLSWYHTVAMSPEVSIDALFDAQICAVSWKRSNLDPSVFKFG